MRLVQKCSTAFGHVLLQSWLDSTRLITAGGSNYLCMEVICLERRVIKLYFITPEPLRKDRATSWYPWSERRSCKRAPCSCWAPPTWPSAGTSPCNTSAHTGSFPELLRTWCCCPRSHKSCTRRLCRSGHAPLSALIPTGNTRNLSGRHININK